MAASAVVGRVARIWRFPVKSMGGEALEQGSFTERGLVGDRAYALKDLETGKVVSAKSVRLFPGILDCRAAFVESPQLERDLPPVRITLPDGRSVLSDSSAANPLLSEYFGRDVELSRVAPEDFTIDQYHPDVEGADPAGRRETIVDQKLGAAFFAEAGLPSPVPAGSFFDLFPASILTTSTLARCSELQPGSVFDERRFRMNLTLQTEAEGFAEDDWVGREILIGDGLRLAVTLPDPRCVMTTLGQDDLEQDLDVLRTLVQYNRIPVGDAGRFPCAGAYAVIAASGEVRVGDEVRLA